MHESLDPLAPPVFKLISERFFAKIKIDLH